MHRQFSSVLVMLLAAGMLVWESPGSISQASSRGEISQLGSWTPQTSGTASELRSVNFTSETEGWAAGANATLLRTSNGGSAWTPVNTGAEPARGFNAVRFQDQNTGWVSGDSVLARTVNAGANWTAAVLPSTNQVSSNVVHNALFPISSTAVWTGGGGISQPSGAPLGTMINYDLTNTGVLQIQTTIGFTGTAALVINRTSDIHFMDARIGWAVGSSGFIAKTDLNQQQPFTFQNSGTTQQLNAIQMLDGNNGWIAGNNGILLKTTNGGMLWTPQTSGTAANLRDVNFIDANHGWAVGDGGVIVTTNNGGGSWTPEPSGTTANLFGVHFASANAGYAVGANGTILKRTGTTAQPTVTTVSAASFTGGILAAESIAAAFGTALAATTQSANTVPLPTTLAGTTVKVRDSQNVERNAPLFFVSPGQINFQIPPGTAVGAATITVINDQSGTAAGTMQIAAVAPGLFTANASGQGVAAAVALRVRGDGSQSFEPVSRFDAAQNQFVSIPIELGPATDQIFLLLFGTGLRNRSALTAVMATIGGESSEVSYAGAQSDFVGLDQINVRVSRSLAGRGEVDVVLTADARTANTVRINIGNALSSGAAPVIANLTLNNPTMSGTTAMISGRLDFTDTDGDIAFNGNIANSARVQFNVSISQNNCTLGLTGFFLHFPGQTSGTINFSGTYNFSTPFLQSATVQVRLIDVAGRPSNALTANVNQWFCWVPGEVEFAPAADSFFEPVWMLRTKHWWELAG